MRALEHRWPGHSSLLRMLFGAVAQVLRDVHVETDARDWRGELLRYVMLTMQCHQALAAGLKAEAHSHSASRVA
eukprot:3669652-Amphidinium_carterae.1